MKKNAKLTKRRKYSKKKFTGIAGIGSLYVVAVVILLSIFAYALVGSALPTTGGSADISPQIIVDIQTPVPNNKRNVLQLYSFSGVTLTPTPSAAANAPSVSCSQTAYDSESQTIIGSNPAPNSLVSGNGAIYVWVTDEAAPFISKGETFSSSTGAVTPGSNRNILDSGTAGDGLFSFEPTLFIYPATNPGGYICNATTVCQAYYPDFIKGTVNNNPSPPFITAGNANLVKGPNVDPYTNYENGPAFTGLGNGISIFGNPQITTQPNLGLQLGTGTLGSGIETFKSEYIWELANLGLTPGKYIGQYVIHDGDGGIGIGCVNITI
jgi:hypothetical protein